MTVRTKFPWSALATAAIAYLVVDRFARGAPWTATSAALTAFALGVAWVPHATARDRGVYASVQAAVAGSAASSVLLVFAFVEPPRSVAGLVASGLLGGLWTFARVRSALTLGAERRRPALHALAPAVAGLLATGVCFAARPHGLLWLFAIVPVATTTALAVRHQTEPDPRIAAEYLVALSVAPMGTIVGMTGALYAADASLSGMLAVSVAVLLLDVSSTVSRDPRWIARRHVVRHATRSVFLASLAMGLTVGLGEDPLWIVVCGVAATVGLSLLRSDADDQAPGRFGRARRAAAERTARAETLPELAAAVLDPLRAAVGDVRAPMELWALETMKRYALDVSGGASEAPLMSGESRPALAWLQTRRGEIAFEEVLASRSQRRADTSALGTWLTERQALALVPVTARDELVGALVIARGDREARPDIDDIDTLGALAQTVGAAIERVRGLERARERAHAAVAQLEAERTRGEHEKTERARTVARIEHAGTLLAVGSLEDAWVGYSASMRQFETRLRELSAGSGPIGLIAEPGIFVSAAVRWVHELSANSQEPCVLLDATQMHPRDALVALAGSAAAPGDEGDDAVDKRPARLGWLERVGRGTLAVIEAPALGADALGALREALRTATVCPVAATEPRTVRARIIVGAREPFVQAGLPADLCTHLAKTTVRMPPLRERVEDLDTLVLFGLDRACRSLGRIAIGIRHDALEALRAYTWPRNERELFDVIEAGVRACSDGQLRVEDLPVHVRGRASTPDGHGPTTDGETYDALERRILQAALDRSGGNKSEAARALGLARTTFLDKLRKFGLRA